MTSSTHDFVYYCERSSVGGQGVTDWFFRPVSEQFPVRYAVPHKRAAKADLETLLERPEEALQYYRQSIEQQADVQAAEVALESARQRAPREVPDSDHAVKRAEEALEHAKKVRAALSLAAKPPAQ